MKQTKPWYTSKVLWWNVIVVFLGIVMVVEGFTYINPWIFLIVNGVGNLILRSITTKKIRWMK